MISCFIAHGKCQRSLPASRRRAGATARIARAGLAALILCLPAGAALSESEAAADSAPHRVATLLPFVADALARIEGPFVVVAEVRRDLRVPVTGAADLGTPHAPSLERLAEARPTLVIGDASLHAAQQERLAIGGAQVMLLDTRSVAATLSALDTLGSRIEAADAMRRETDAVRRHLAESRVVSPAKSKPVPTLALFGASSSFLVLTERTWLGDLLDTLGFHNVGDVAGGDERFPGLVALSDETLATLQPELVLLVTHGDPAAIESRFAERTGGGGSWQSLRRTATRGVHVLDPKLFTANPGLGLVQAADALRALVSPAGEGAER